MRLVPLLTAALCLCGSVQAREPAKSLLQPHDLRYLGAFRVPAKPPAGQSWRSSFSYGGTALTYNPQRHSLFLVGHDHQQFVAEIAIPDPVRTGPAGSPIGSRTSAGPAAVGCDPDRLGAKPAPALPLVYYPLQHPLGPLVEKNPHWNLACTLAGMAFVSSGGRTALIFVGRRGLGEYWYGEPEEDGKKDPIHPSKGP